MLRRPDTRPSLRVWQLREGSGQRELTTKGRTRLTREGAPDCYFAVAAWRTTTGRLPKPQNRMFVFAEDAGRLELCRHGLAATARQ